MCTQVTPKCYFDVVHQKKNFINNRNNLTNNLSLLTFKLIIFQKNFI